MFILLDELPLVLLGVCLCAKSILTRAYSVYFLSLALCFSANALVPPTEIPTCDSSVVLTGTNISTGRIEVTVKNKGANAALVELRTYKKYSDSNIDTANPTDNSYPNYSLGAGLSYPLSTSFDTRYTSVVVLRINNSCESDIKTFTGSLGFWPICHTCPTPTPAPTCTPTPTPTPIRDCAGTINGSAVIDRCGVCGGNGNSCVDCRGVLFGTAKIDACGVCGGTITDPTQCPEIEQCVTVEATAEITAYEEELIKQTKMVTKKYLEEEKRGKKNKCGIDTKASSKKVASAYKTIVDAGNQIFSQGVEVCGKDCVTVSYADQITALTPQIKIIEKETVALANKVKACYKRKHIKTPVKIPGVSTTIKLVNESLKQLVLECSDTQVCP